VYDAAGHVCSRHALFAFLFLPDPTSYYLLGSVPRIKVKLALEPRDVQLLRRPTRETEQLSGEEQLTQGQAQVLLLVVLFLLSHSLL
jgi:hypothetical protein